MTTLALAWAQGAMWGCEEMAPFSEHPGLEEFTAANPYTNNAIEQARNRVVEAAKVKAEKPYGCGELGCYEEGLCDSCEFKLDDLCNAVRALRDLESEAK